MKYEKPIDEPHQKRLPDVYEAEQVARMSRENYIKWFARTPEEQRSRVIAALKHLAKSKADEARRILDLINTR